MTGVWKSKRKLFLVCGLFAAHTVSAQTNAPDGEPPILTLNDAVALAAKANRQVQSSILSIRKAEEGTAELRALRYLRLNTFLLGGTSLNTVSTTIPKGALGTYAATGPIPAQNAKIENPPGSYSGTFFLSIGQPITQLYKIKLDIRESKVNEGLARESLRQRNQETVLQVKSAYYRAADIQSQIESEEANLKYLVELSALADRRFIEEAVLKSDVLNVRAKTIQQRYQLLQLRDSLETQKENLNNLLGRELAINFRVEPAPDPTVEEFDLKAAQRRALEQRPEVREARLGVAKAELEVRRERAKYIPDISMGVTYISFTGVNTLPANIAHAGFQLQWEPWDWGRKSHRIEQLQISGKQAGLSQTDAEKQVLLDVNTTYRKLLEARALLVARAAVQQTERERLRIVTNRFEEKAALLADVLDQQSAVSLADSQYHQALEDLWKAKAEFERAIGED